MASIGQLIAVLAESLQIEETTVVVFVRNLRDAGLIRKGGRGSSAARMAPLDASRALISFLTVDRSNPRKAVDAVRRVGQFNCQDVQLFSEDGQPDPLDFQTFLGLPPRHSFEEGLAGLVAALMDPAYRNAIANNTSDIAGMNFLPQLKVQFDDSKNIAAITFNRTRYVYMDPIELLIFEAKSLARREKLMKERLETKPRAGGLRTERYVFWSEVIPVVECLSNEADAKANVDEA